MIIPITAAHYDTYFALTQPYEAEFSSLTGAELDEQGFYPLSTPLDEVHLGYLYEKEGRAVGFIVIDVSTTPYDVCELFVDPAYRCYGIARALSIHAFETHRGAWSVKQLEQAISSRSFWVRLLKDFAPEYTESLYIDEKWGLVYRQLFRVS